MASYNTYIVCVFLLNYLALAEHFCAPLDRLMLLRTVSAVVNPPASCAAAAAAAAIASAAAVAATQQVSNANACRAVPCRAAGDCCVYVIISFNCTTFARMCVCVQQHQQQQLQ